MRLSPRPRSGIRAGGVTPVGNPRGAGYTGPPARISDPVGGGLKVGATVPPAITVPSGRTRFGPTAASRGARETGSPGVCAPLRASASPLPQGRAVPEGDARWGLEETPVTLPPRCEKRGKSRGVPGAKRQTARSPQARRGAGAAEAPACDPRELLYALRDAVRPRARERCGKCGRTRVSKNVQIILTPEGRAHYAGVLACGSIWECPVCAAKIKRRRAEEITKLVEAHGQARASMLTLTVRHAKGDSLRQMRTKIANAWRKMQAGRPWQRFARAVGLVGTVRYSEPTHGENGWHPHLHVLLLTTVEARDPRWTETAATNDGTWENWLSLRWRKKVRAVLGPEHEPDGYHGARIDPCHNKRYLAKLGLELSDPFYKTAGGGNRAPFELARDWAFKGDGEALGLWARYTRDMFRARCHTWSKGLRERYGLREKKDEAIAEEPERGELLHEIPGPVWDQVKRRRGAPLRLLQAAEARDFDRTLAAILAGKPNAIDWTPPPKAPREPVPLDRIDAEWVNDWQIERAKRKKAADARPGPVRGLSRPGDVRTAITQALRADRPPRGSTGAESNRVARDWYRSNADLRIAELRDILDRALDRAESFDRSA